MWSLWISLVGEGDPTVLAAVVDAAAAVAAAVAAASSAIVGSVIDFK